MGLQRSSAEVKIMIGAARAAGESLLRDFAQLETLKVIEKNPSDFVSNADLRSQEMLCDVLAQAYPSHDLVLEEGKSQKHISERDCFLVDPLDGTTNFLHGIPHFAVSLGLAVGGDVVAGVVCDPVKGELFWAEKNRGAWLGERQLRVSRERSLSRSVVGTGIPHRGGAHHERYLEALARVMPRVAGVRRMGAAALDLAYVAAGRFEAFFETGLAPWDVAAGAILVREAGGILTRENGAPFALDASGVLASNGEPLHGAVVDLLAMLCSSCSEEA